MHLSPTRALGAGLLLALIALADLAIRRGRGNPL